MWLNIQTCLVLAFAIKTAGGSADLPMPGLENFLKTSMRDYKRWLYFNELDPSEKIPFVNLTTGNYNPDKPFSDYMVGNLTNYSIEWHSNIYDAYATASHSNINVLFHIKGYISRGTYILEGINEESRFNGTGEFSMECNRGYVNLVFYDVGQTPDGFLDLSSAFLLMMDDNGDPSKCWCALENFNGTAFYTGPVADFACATLYQTRRWSSPLTLYLKTYIEELFKINPKDFIANATLPPDFTDSMKEIKKYKYGRDEPEEVHYIIDYTQIRHAPEFPVVLNSPLKGLPVPGLQNFLTISMNNYENWLLNKGLDPSEISFVDLIESNFKVNCTGNITNSWVEGYSNIRSIDVHATETDFSIYVNLKTYRYGGTYSVEGLHKGVAFNGSDTFKSDCVEGYVFIVGRNVCVRDGFLDLSSTFIRTASSHPWRCRNIFENATWSSPIKWTVMESYSKRLTQQGSPLTVHLKMYLEELFKTTPIEVIAKTTLPPYLEALSVTKSSSNNKIQNHTEIATWNNQNCAKPPQAQQIGAGSYLRVQTICLISSLLILFCY